MHRCKPSQRAQNELKNSTSWGRVHFLTMMNKLANSNTEFRAPGANLLLKGISSAVEARNGHSRLGIKCMRETAFWNIFGSVSRHSSCGDRVAKVKTDQLSYLRLLGEEDTLIGDNDHDVESVCYCTAARIPTSD